MVKKILDHPLTPLLVGAGVTIEGPGNIVVRSGSLLFCGLWLCYDIGIRLRKKAWRLHWKIITFSIAWCVTFVCVMLVMKWLLSLKLEELQSDAYEKLSVTALMPPGAATNPDPTLFSVVNGGKTEFATYQIVCVINYLQHDKVVFRAHPPLDETFQQLARSSNHLGAHGGSDSASCLEKYVISANFVCADVTVKVNYTLESEITEQKSKRFRFATAGNNGAYEWVSKNPSDSETYCMELKPAVIPGAQAPTKERNPDTRSVHEPVIKAYPRNLGTDSDGLVETGIYACFRWHDPASADYRNGF